MKRRREQSLSDEIAAPATFRNFAADGREVPLTQFKKQRAF
jgi:hypothetical protein